MRTLLLTGPSASGKDWVAERLTKANPQLNNISIDDLFDYIKAQDFADSAFQSSGHKCIRLNYHTVDFSTRFAEALSMRAFDPSRDTLVQGYQLTVPVVREPLFNVIGLDPKASLMLGIYPSPRTLLNNRRDSEKTYHQERANIQHCTELVTWHETTFDKNLPPFRFRKCTSSDEALEQAIRFFATPPNRDLNQARQ